MGHLMCHLMGHVTGHVTSPLPVIPSHWASRSSWHPHRLSLMYSILYLVWASIDSVESYVLCVPKHLERINSLDWQDFPQNPHQNVRSKPVIHCCMNFLLECRLSPEWERLDPSKAVCN
jgi:hypothetical protein